MLRIKQSEESKQHFGRQLRAAIHRGSQNLKYFGNSIPPAQQHTLDYIIRNRLNTVDRNDSGYETLRTTHFDVFLTNAKIHARNSETDSLLMMAEVSRQYGFILNLIKLYPKLKELDLNNSSKRNAHKQIIDALATSSLEGFLETVYRPEEEDVFINAIDDRNVIPDNGELLLFLGKTTAGADDIEFFIAERLRNLSFMDMLGLNINGQILKDVTKLEPVRKLVTKSWLEFSFCKEIQEDNMLSWISPFTLPQLTEEQNTAVLNELYQCIREYSFMNNIIQPKTNRGDITKQIKLIIKNRKKPGDLEKDVAAAVYFFKLFMGTDPRVFI